MQRYKDMTLFTFKEYWNLCSAYVKPKGFWGHIGFVGTVIASYEEHKYDFWAYVGDDMDWNYIVKELGNED